MRWLMVSAYCPQVPHPVTLPAGEGLGPRPGGRAAGMIRLWNPARATDGLV